jgi:hypothetical protein
MAYFNIDELQVASPCSVPWSGMNGNDTVRSCVQCEKNVYDLSLLTRAESSDLIREKEGKLCIRFYKRFDGTVLTADCPKGLRAIRKSYLKSRARVLAVVIGIATMFSTFANSCRTTNTGQSSAVTAKQPSPDSDSSNSMSQKATILSRLHSREIMGDFVTPFIVDTNRRSIDSISHR